MAPLPCIELFGRVRGSKSYATADAEFDLGNCLFLDVLSAVADLDGAVDCVDSVHFENVLRFIGSIEGAGS